MLRDPDAAAHRQGLLLRKEGGSGVALFLRIVPVLVIVREAELRLPFLKLRLLKAEDIRVQSVKITQKGLSEHGAKPIDIPGNQFLHHENSSIYSCS